ncbi:MAG: hypothetical protein GTO18_07840 [Anaerolineales bacterium]|nr:hypothetical protein [Anaerolineales bacterium]
MRKKLMFGIALTLLAAMVLPVVAFAAGGGGTGTLVAYGDGTAGVRGNGEVKITGRGVLYIKDHAGDANIQVSGTGKRIELPNGWIQYVGFNGKAYVAGSLISVGLKGSNIALHATGTGRFILWGNGTYEVNGTSGRWTEPGVVLELK